jgi:hypothetical protein
VNKTSLLKPSRPQDNTKVRSLSNSSNESAMLKFNKSLSGVMSQPPKKAMPQQKANQAQVSPMNPKKVSGRKFPLSSKYKVSTSTNNSPKPSQPMVIQENSFVDCGG